MTIQVTSRNASIMPLVAIAMHDYDSYVLRLVYEDSKGVKTRRVVSPYHWVGEDRFHALCLCKEDLRLFELRKCSEVELVDANDVLAPVPLEVVCQMSNK